MTELSPGAARLLDEHARDHGVRKLAFDQNGLIPMTVRDTQIALAYSRANDSLFLTAVVQEAPASFDPWWAMELSGVMAPRRARLAVEPNSKALVLVAEIQVEGLEYWRLLEGLEAFVADYATALEGAGASLKPVGETSAPPELAYSSDMLLFRP